MNLKISSYFLLFLINFALCKVNYGRIGDTLNRYDEVGDFDGRRRDKRTAGQYEVYEDLGIEENILDKEHHRPFLRKQNKFLITNVQNKNSETKSESGQPNLIYKPSTVNSPNGHLLTTFVNGQIQSNVVSQTNSQVLSFSSDTNNPQNNSNYNPAVSSSLQNQENSSARPANNGIKNTVQEHQFLGSSGFKFNPNYTNVVDHYQESVADAPNKKNQDQEKFRNKSRDFDMRDRQKTRERQQNDNGNERRYGNLGIYGTQNSYGSDYNRGRYIDEDEFEDDY